MKVHGHPLDKVLVRKLPKGKGWFADCPACPISTGFYVSPFHWVALTWAIVHVRDVHRMKGQYIERPSA